MKNEKVEEKEKVYKPTEVAKILKIDVQTVLRLIRRGKIRAIKIYVSDNRYIYRIPKEEVERILSVGDQD